ncbi:NUDIX domain-containing protein [Candidatus Woesebacteria bacterium]|nr:NUDIX domain-containing protein [Candidatus Woesebacteria bacterium]
MSAFGEVISTVLKPDDRIVSTCIIHKKGKYLITQRSLDKKVWPGRWTVPGGGLEIDDYVNLKPTTKSRIWYLALEGSLRREIKEEVGVEIGEIDYLLDLAFVRPDNIPVITLSFYAPWKKGKVRLNIESINFAWITAKETEKYNLIEGIAEEILMVDQILKGRKINKAKFFK